MADYLITRTSIPYIETELPVTGAPTVVSGLEEDWLTQFDWIDGDGVVANDPDPNFYISSFSATASNLEIIAAASLNALITLDAEIPNTVRLTYRTVYRNRIKATFVSGDKQEALRGWGLIRLSPDESELLNQAIQAAGHTTPRKEPDSLASRRLAEGRIPDVPLEVPWLLREPINIRAVTDLYLEHSNNTRRGTVFGSDDLLMLLLSEVYGTNVNVERANVLRNAIGERALEEWRSRQLANLSVDEVPGAERPPSVELCDLLSWARDIARIGLGVSSYIPLEALVAAILAPRNKREESCANHIVMGLDPDTSAARQRLHRIAGEDRASYISEPGALRKSATMSATTSSAPIDGFGTLPDRPPSQEQEWNALLLGGDGGTLLEKPITSGYDSDLSDGMRKDHLSIQPDVDAFARLICLKSTAPPLAIALFGAWGSGKTFFMRKMQEAVRSLCDQQRVDRDIDADGETAFATEVRQIEFNAWTYSEKDLMASLAVEIFEKLLELTTGETRAEKKDRDRNEALLGALQSAKTAQADAKKKLKTAQGALKRAEGALLTAEQEAEAKRKELDTMASRDFMWDLAQRELEKGSDVTGALAQIGLDGVTKSAADLVDLNGRTRDMAGRIGLVWRRFLKDPWGERWLWGGMAFIAGLSLLPLAIEMPFNTFFVQLSAATAGLVAWATKALSAVDGLLKPIEAQVKAYDAERQEIETRIAKEIRAVQAERDALEEKVADLRAKLVLKETAAADAQSAVDNDTPSARLNRFIRDRADASDYRQHLGIIGEPPRVYRRLRALRRWSL